MPKSNEGKAGFLSQHINDPKSPADPPSPAPLKPTKAKSGGDPNYPGVHQTSQEDPDNPANWGSPQGQQHGPEFQRGMAELGATLGGGLIPMIIQIGAPFALKFIQNLLAGLLKQQMGAQHAMLPHDEEFQRGLSQMGGFGTDLINKIVSIGTPFALQFAFSLLAELQKYIANNPDASSGVAPQ